MDQRTLVLLLSCLLGSFFWANIGAQTTDCSQYSTCDSCIAASRDCAWCTDTIFASAERCYLNGTGTCNAPESPQSGSTVTMNNASFQIRPQEVNVQLRAGDTRTLDFTFQPGSNFPLDVYFLMDFGPTMTDDFNNFRTNLAAILDAINMASSDNRVAFGTFVDKPTETFVGNLGSSTSCLSSASCYRPHSFAHHVNFTTSGEFEAAFDAAFTVLIAQTSVKANPFNSGLDAVVQVAGCFDDINWRDLSTQTRRVLIYMSDSAFHLSSDAWIGGQTRPHDGKCHLAPNPNFGGGQFRIPHLLPDVLTDHFPALQQEYASPALVQNKLESARIVPAFLVTANQTDVYATLVEALSQNNAASFELNDDSSNLVTLLGQLFGSLQANIRLSPEVVEGLTVQVAASCSTGEPNVCTGVVQNQEYSFNVTVTLNECTEELSRGVLLPISDPFLGTTTLNVTGVCSCDCSAVDPTPNDCNGNGSLRCGICDCNPGFFGPTCSCPQPPACPILTGNIECSGHGMCDECGICNCTDGFYGDSCECSDTNCPGGANNLCSGNGQCVCGVCQCNSGYTMRPGSALCDCPMNQTSCLEPNTMKLCSDKGSCMCGECQCETGHGGIQCQNCLAPENCGPCNCEIHHPCLRCLYSISADNTLVERPFEECAAECQGPRINAVMGSDDAAIGMTTVYGCSLSLGGCTLQYFIQVTNDPDTVFVVNNPQNCPLVVPAWAIAIAIFAALVIIGIIALALLKLILYLLDVMEYKRFLKDVSRTQFGETQNPLYRAPETLHPNPLFQGKAKEAEAPTSPPGEVVAKC